MMPGPVTTLIVTETARRGFIAGPFVTLGHALLELAMVVALVFGVGDLLKQNAVAGTIGLLGKLFLLWMGCDIVKSVWQGKASCLSVKPRGMSNAYQLSRMPWEACVKVLGGIPIFQRPCTTPTFKNDLTCSGHATLMHFATLNDSSNLNKVQVRAYPKTPEKPHFPEQ
jgi:hypothetical protein